MHEKTARREGGCSATSGTCWIPDRVGVHLSWRPLFLCSAILRYFEDVSRGSNHVLSMPIIRYAFFQKCRKFFSIARFTLPYNQDIPSVCQECFPVFLIASHIATPFFVPEFCAGRRRHSTVATVVTMPETAMHKYGGVILEQHDVRFSREVFSMKTKPISE
jgi:hypothetical protein